MEITCKIREDATKKGGFGWETVKLVAPLSIGNYLDKQLDERYISFYSKKEIYHAGAVVGIGYKKDGQPREWEYFILGRDSSAQSSFKKNIYFHQDAFLLEATKYLEGILCQSITFTNRLAGNITTRSITPDDVAVDNVYGAPRTELNDDQRSSLKIFQSPVANGVMTAPTVRKICNGIIENRNKITYHEAAIAWYFYDSDAKKNVYPYIEITSAAGKTRHSINEEALLDKAFEYTVAGTTTIRYVVYISLLSNTWETRQYAFEYTQMGTLLRQESDAWTINSVVDRILNLAEPLFASKKSDGTLTVPSSRFYLSPNDAFNKYKDTVAPEFTLTECNLREQLQTVGGFLHAEPRATYAPDENAFKISFDDYGNPETVDLSRAKLIERRAGVDLAQYATEVKSNAQNLVNSLSNEAPLCDPADKFFRSTRSESIYARITDENARVYTQYPIYSIEKVECGLISEVKVSTNSVTWKIDPVDITNFVYEKTEYDANLSSYDTGNSTSKAHAIYYTQGQAGLDGLFYQVPNTVNTAVYSPYAISNILAICSGRSISEVDNLFTDKKEENKAFGNLAFRVTYTPIFSATVSHGKSKYDATLPKWQQAYNQSGNMIETSYYGENLRATAAMLGNPEEERTYLLPPAEELPTVGQRLDDFAVSAVKAEIYPRYTKVTLALTRDFERISEYVGINSTKRVYEVSEKEVYNRNVLLKSYIVIGTPPEKYESDILPNLPLRLDMGLLADGLSAGEQNHVSCVYATMIDKNGGELSRMMLPVVTSSFGSTMTFSFSYKDNYSAGERAEYIGGGKDTEISGYWLNDVPYANILGHAEYLKASFFKEPKNAYTPGMDYLTLPATSYADALSNPTIYFQKPYLLEKDSREKISVHVSIEFKTESDQLILGSALARMNAFVGGTLSDCYVSLLSRRCGKMQRYIASEDKVGKEVNVTKSLRKSNGQTIAVSFDPVLWSAFKNDDGTFPKNVGWAVYREGSDGKEEILLACNQPLAENGKLFESGFTFYQMNA